jgi:hypothetical protein
MSVFSTLVERRPRHPAFRPKWPPLPRPLKGAISFFKENALLSRFICRTYKISINFFYLKKLFKKVFTKCEKRIDPPLLTQKLWRREHWTNVMNVMTCKDTHFQFPHVSQNQIQIHIKFNEKCRRLENFSKPISPLLSGLRSERVKIL